MDDSPEHLDKTEARAANSNPVNRVVLTVSLVIIVIVFALVLLVKG